MSGAYAHDGVEARTVVHDRQAGVGSARQVVHIECVEEYQHIEQVSSWNRCDPRVLVIILVRVAGVARQEKRGYHYFALFRQPWQ